MDQKNKKLLALVVEDEKPLRDIIEEKLKHGGFDVLTADSIDKAFVLLEKSGKVDVVWLDHYLPDKNGLELVTRMKDGTHEAWKNIPIFVVSNTASADNIFSYISLGINKYYTKADFRLEKIVEDIKIFLGQQG